MTAPNIRRSYAGIPQPRRVGCLAGCGGYSHDPDCPVTHPTVPSPPAVTCSRDYACKRQEVAVLARSELCPCSQSLAAHAVTESQPC